MKGDTFPMQPKKISIERKPNQTHRSPKALPRSVCVCVWGGGVGGGGMIITV